MKRITSDEHTDLLGTDFKGVLVIWFRDCEYGNKYYLAKSARQFMALSRADINAVKFNWPRNDN